MTADDEDALFFVRTWAEAVIRQLERVRDLREMSDADFIAREKSEPEWQAVAEEELSHSFRLRWVEEHMLIWASHQLEKWNERLAHGGRQPPQRDPVLADLRNALEHLDEATFVEGLALPGGRGSNRSLRRLPGASLGIALGNDSIGEFISHAELEKRALAVVKQVEDELEGEIQAQIEAALEWHERIARD
jgi:hypothetical protein